MGVTGRTFYRRRFPHRDGRDWALVTSMENWAELDGPGNGNFQETFIELHGEAAWDTHRAERAEAVVGTQDEFRQRIAEMSGVGNQ